MMESMIDSKQIFRQPRYTIGGSVGQVAVTVSVGVSSFPEHGSTPEKILEAADHALYAAKSAGRNRVEIAGKHFPQKSRPWSATSTSET